MAEQLTGTDRLQRGKTWAIFSICASLTRCATIMGGGSPRPLGRPLHPPRQAHASQFLSEIAVLYCQEDPALRHSQTEVLMRLALFSDIHGNLTGLQAVLAAIAASGGADIILAAGDLISGESATDEIIDLLVTHQVRMVRGDGDTEDKLLALQHQARTAPGSTRNSLRYYAALQAWLQTHLSPAGRAFLAALPLSQTIEVAPGQRLYLCHASPRSVADRVCAPSCDPATIRAAYAEVDAEVIAFGHSHTPYTRLLDGRLYINVASVGFRQDGTSMLTFVTYSDAQWLVQQQAIPYDVAREEARKRQRQVPLPDA